MIERGESIRVVHPLFHGEGGGSTPTSPLQFHIGEVRVEVAMRLNELWHSRLPSTVKTNLDSKPHSLFYAAEHAGVYYAAAMWADPIARMLNGRAWLELRRFAIAPDAPSNTGSRMLRVMAILIRRKWPHILRLISYQDTEVHSGCIYRAAGWRPSVTSAGGQWARPSRARADVQTRAPKVRWELDL